MVKKNSLQTPISIETPPKNTRNTEIDKYKFIAFIFVVIIHTSHALESYGPSLLGFLDQFSRFAVPFFFLTSGYFLGIKNRPKLQALRRISFRILAIFAFWSFFYVLISHPPLKEILSFKFILKWALSGGPGYHLWFLPSLLICLTVFVVTLWAFGRPGALFFSILLYCFGVAFGSYRLALGLPDISFNTHNGPFFGTLFIAIGFLISKKIITTPYSSAVILAGVGFAAHIGESTILNRFGFISFSANEFSFGTVLFATGIFLMALGSSNLDTTKNKAAILSFDRLGHWSLGLYCIHVAYIWTFSKLFHQFEIIQVLTLTFLVIISSVATVLLLAKIPLMRRFLE